MQMIPNTSTPVLVLRAVSHGGLNILRSLGRCGVPVHILEADPWAPSYASRYCKRRFFWDIENRPEEESLEYLARASREIGRPAILIPTTDRTAMFVDRHAHALKNWFVFPQQPSGLVSLLCSKKQMHLLAQRNGVPTPGAIFPKSRDDVLAFLVSARFPVVLKGIDGQKLQDLSRKTVFIVQTPAELLRKYDEFEDCENPNLMLQEYIPGGDDSVWMFNGYFDERSDCLVGFTGKKIRQCPIHTGCTSLGIATPNDAVEATTKKFMKAVGYRGILDIGFRYDYRDNLYKVLDANPRIGATFRLFVGENGMDVAHALYLDLTGQSVPATRQVSGRRWIVEDLDFVSSCRYMRAGELTPGEWLRSLKGIDEAAFFATDDLLPLVPMLLGRSREFAVRLQRKVDAALTKAFPRQSKEREQKCEASGKAAQLAEPSLAHYSSPRKEKRADFRQPAGPGATVGTPH